MCAIAFVLPLYVYIYSQKKTICTLNETFFKELDAQAFEELLAPIIITSIRIIV